MNKWIPVITVVAVISIVVGWYVSGQMTIPKPVQPAPSPVQEIKPKKARIKLSMIPEFTSLKAGEKGLVNIVAYTGELGLSGVESTLTYDPEYLQVLSVKPGLFLTEPTSLVENIYPVRGSVEYTLASLKYSQGEGTVYTLQVKALKPVSEIALKFDRRQTKAGLQNKVEDKRYAENEVLIDFREQPFSILP